MMENNGCMIFISLLVICYALLDALVNYGIGGFLVVMFSGIATYSFLAYLDERERRFLIIAILALISIPLIVYYLILR